MKSLLTTLLIGVFLFVASAGLSWWLIYEGDQVAEQPDETSSSSTEDHPALDMNKDEERHEVMPVGIRPDAPISVEIATELAQSMLKKERALFEAEQALKRKEKRVNILFEDLEREQEKLMAFHSKIEAKIMEGRETLKLLQLEKKVISEKTESLSALEKRTGKKSGNLKQDELDDRLKTVKNWFKAVDDEQAADYLKEFANRGEIEFVAKLLGSMEDRKAAKVLSSMNDAPLIAQIVESLSPSSADKSKKNRLR